MNGWHDAPDEPLRRLAVGEYSAPTNARIEEGRVFWLPVMGWRKVKPTVEMFTRFVNLAVDGSDKAVLGYVKRWGPLMESGEPVSEYIKWASTARSILRVGEDLEAGELGTATDWKVIVENENLRQQVGGRAPLTNVRAERQSFKYKQARQKQSILLAAYINAWLILGEVRPALTWDSYRSSLNLTTSGPLGALAVQLLENAGLYTIAACTGCRRFFDATPVPVNEEGRKRRPKFGQGRYCPDCQEAGVPVALAKRKQATKKRTGPARKRR